MILCWTRESDIVIAVMRPISPHVGKKKLPLCSLWSILFFFYPREYEKNDATQTVRDFSGGTLCAVLCVLESDQRRAPCHPPMRCSRIHQYHMCVPISGSTCHMPECASVMLSPCQPSRCPLGNRSSLVQSCRWSYVLIFTVYQPRVCVCM